MFEIDSYVTYGSIFRLREKVIEPVGEARNDYLIMAELANRLGYGHLYPQTEEELIDFAMQGSGFTPEQVRENGGWVKLDTPMMEYKKWKKGKLRDDGQDGFNTPTGKFELWSTILDDYGYEPLPKYEEPSESPQSSPGMTKRFPLVFNSGARTQTYFRSQHHGIEGMAVDHPEPFVEVNDRDAASRGIVTGDLVEVRTKRGAVRFRAFVTDRIAPGSIEANMGGGSPVGPEAWQKWNVNELTDWTNYDRISGFPVYKALLCEVVKVEAGSDSATPGVLAARADGLRSKSARSGVDSLTVNEPAGKHLYLDNNATTALDPAVLDAMRPFLEQRHGNPSSVHRWGREARDGLETARRQVAALLHCRPRRLVFTGGGSEADNLALKGVVFARWPEPVHVITSRIEHPGILKTAAWLEKLGVRVTYLDVDEDGLIHPDTLKAALTSDTTLVSIMLANNEVGTIQPVKELCAIAHDAGALFHTDAVQAVGKIPISIDDLNIDLLTISAHKFHGPKGIGALYVRKGVELEPLVHGGNQEGGLRAGTENIAAIVGMGKAAELAGQRLPAMSAITSKRDRLEAGICELIPNARLNGHPQQRLPNTLNVTLPGLRGESLVVAMDQHGVSMSSGSACKAGSPDPTHVLLAMGRSTEDAHCCIRISLDDRVTDEDVDTVISAFKTVLDEMENTIRFLACK
ncbi:cysteine desulfurase [bacterium BMS3Bbin04]|nr:cysteine desulfurase [bacterium BMS3Bbin04]